jgi:phage baseplate assembly protein W
MPLRLSLPLQVAADGALAAVEQDTPAEVAQSVALLLSTRPGERRSVPDYGSDDPMFSGLTTEDVYAAVEMWEDRADPVTVEFIASGIEQYAEVYPNANDEEVFA